MRSDRLLGTFLGVLLAAPAAPSTLVERILAVVNGRPVMLSDVRAVEGRDGVTREDALERVIDEMLLFEEAFRLPQGPARSAVTAAPGDAEDPASRRLRERRAAIERYTVFRFRPQVRAAGEEAQAETSARVAEWVKELRTGAHIRYNGPD
jgi:hypothetical protein